MINGQQPPARESRGSRRRFSRLAALLAGCMALAFPEMAKGQTSAVGEYPVKAAFLFNFTKYVDWPATAFTNTAAPIIIGILGDDPFGRKLDDIISSELVKSRPLTVRRLTRMEEANSCHLLFISRSEKDRIADILAGLRGAPVVAVSEIEGFCRKGGVFNFVLTNQNIRFEINPAAAERAGLKISSKLLNLPKAIKVSEETPAQ
jgi:hypothetical protein